MQFEGYTLKISFYEMSIRFRLLTCFGSFFFCGWFDQMSRLLIFCDKYYEEYRMFL